MIHTTMEDTITILTLTPTMTHTINPISQVQDTTTTVRRVMATITTKEAVMRIAAPVWRGPAALAVFWRPVFIDRYILIHYLKKTAKAAVVGIFRRNNRDSALIIFPAMQDSLPHAVSVLNSLVLALTDVDVRDHFLPPGLYVQFG